MRYGLPAVQLPPTLVAREGRGQDMAEAVDPVRQSPSGLDRVATFARRLRENGIEVDVGGWLTRPRILSLIPRSTRPTESYLD